jgi:hypothetical protein
MGAASMPNVPTIVKLFCEVVQAVAGRLELELIVGGEGVDGVDELAVADLGVGRGEVGTGQAHLCHDCDPVSAAVRGSRALRRGGDAVEARRAGLGMGVGASEEASAS